MNSSSLLVSSAAAFRAVAKSRHSAKRFEVNRTIPCSILSDIMETTLSSPSGFNLQPTHVVLVSDSELKTQLSEHAMLGPGNSFRAKDCSMLAVFICDVQLHKRIPRILQLERESGMRDVNYLASFPVVTSFLLSGGGASNGVVSRAIKRVATDIVSPIKPAPTIESVDAWSYKNASFLAATWVLSATSHGLATCIMEGFDARRVSQTLRIPLDRYRIPLMVATGYEYIEENKEGCDSLNQSKKTPRLPIHDVFFSNTFGQPWTDPSLSIGNENIDYDPATTQSDISEAVGIRQDLSLVLPSAK